MTSTQVSQQVLQQVKYVMKLFSSEKAEHQALLSYDFKMSDFKTSLMRLCFSPLASWPIFVFALILFLNPLRYQHQIFTHIPSLIQFVYAPNWAAGLAIGIVCSYFLGLINIPIALVLYFISQGDMHVVLGASILVGVFFGRPLKYLKLTVNLEGKVKSVVIYYALLQILSVVVGAAIVAQVYQFMYYTGYFSQTVFGYRLEYCVLLLLIMFAVQLAVHSIWGHFYSRRPDEPSRVNTFYSTSQILKKLFYSKSFAEELRTQALAKHTELSLQLKDPSVSYLPRNILQIAEAEKSYLETAMRF